MFNTEESLDHLKELRLKVALIKGEAVEGLTPLEKEDEANNKAMLLKKQQQEMNA